MIRCYLLTLAFLPLAGHAADAPGSECAARGRYAEEMLLSAIAKEGVTGVVRGKTKVEVLSLSSVSDAFASQLAQADMKTGNGLSFKEYYGLSFKEYYGIYHDNGTMNLTAKYTYTNAKGERNVYVVSSLLNNDECSVRFNGFLTLSREF